MYPKYSERVSKIYESIEKATALCLSFRGWFMSSVLTPLMTWDGLTPEEPLMQESHLKGDAAKIAYATEKALRNAVTELREMREDAILSANGDMLKTAKNPHDVAKMLETPPIIARLSEDIRGLIYGADVFGFMALCLDYYDSLYEKRGDSKELYEKIKVLGEKMSEYTFGVSYAAHEPERELRDALKRSQLNKLYYNILANGRV